MDLLNDEDENERWVSYIVMSAPLSSSSILQTSCDVLTCIETCVTYYAHRA